MSDLFKLPDLVDNRSGRLGYLLGNLISSDTTLSVVTAYFIPAWKPDKQ